MPTLNPAPTHKPVKSYYAALDRFTHLNLTRETAVRSAFQSLLEHCARQLRCTLVPEHAVNPRANKRVIVDGALIDDFHHRSRDTRMPRTSLLRPASEERYDAVPSAIRGLVSYRGPIFMSFFLHDRDKTMEETSNFI